MSKEKVTGPTVVCSAFIKKQGKFLLVFDPLFKVWRVPGGRVESGENLEETLIREMQEEVGIIFKNPKFLGFGQDNQYHFLRKKKTPRLLMFYYVKTDKELIIDPGEAEDFKWVTFKELRNHKNKEGGLTDFFKRNPSFKI